MVLITSAILYGRRKPIVLGVRMAEWLRPGLWEVLMLSRGIEPGQILISNKSIWHVALVSITSAILYGRRKPNFKGSGMAEWLKARAL